MTEWLIVAAGILAAGLFAAAESALPIVNRTRLRQVAGGSARGERAVLELIGDSSRTLDFVRVGAQLGVLVAASLGVAWCAARFAGDLPWIGTGVGLWLLLAWARLFAKSRARRDAERALLWLALPLRLASFVLGPAAYLAGSAARGLLALAGARPDRGGPSAARPVVEEMVHRAEQGAEARPAPGLLVQHVLDFGETTLEEVMVPRTEVVAVEVGTPVRDVVARIRQHRFSRLPVYRDDLDHIVGMVHQFDLFNAREAGQPVDELMRPIAFVPESKKCDDLLREMQQSGQGMAVVLDEFGGTAGMVTAEDLLEELVGELGEEEAERVTVRRVDSNVFVADGWAGVHDINEMLGVEIPEGEYETLAGYVIEQLGRIPHRGEVVGGPNYRIEVLSADRRRVRSLRVERLGVEPAAPGGEQES